MASRREFAVGEAPQGGAVSGVGGLAPCVIPRRVIVPFQLTGAEPATALSCCIFTADAPPDGSGVATAAPVYQVMGVQARYEVAGGAASVLDIKKVPSGTAIAAGVSVLGTQFDLTQAATNTYKKNDIAGGMSATPANRLLAPGDSLAIITGGTVAGLANLSITVELKRVAFQR